MNNCLSVEPWGKLKRKALVLLLVQHDLTKEKHSNIGLLDCKYDKGLGFWEELLSPVDWNQDQEWGGGERF